MPGVENLGLNEDLVAVWKVKGGKRFQNYQAKFTILDAHRIPRTWLNDIKSGAPLSENCPAAWRDWVERRVYRPLKAPRAIEWRSREEQLPNDGFGHKIIETIVAHFSDEPVRFEKCAGKIAELMLPSIVSLDITRPSRDGGRDGVGTYRIGSGASAVVVDFALEAKCYGQGNSVGVKELSRLISRLRHRQFGILVTTSHVAQQAYEEIRSDQHPIVIIAAAEIVDLLKAAGINSEEALAAWLASF